MLFCFGCCGKNGGGVGCGVVGEGGKVMSTLRDEEEEDVTSDHD